MSLIPEHLSPADKWLFYSRHSFPRKNLNSQASSLDKIYREKLDSFCRLLQKSYSVTIHMPYLNMYRINLNQKVLDAQITDFNYLILKTKELAKLKNRKLGHFCKKVSFDNFKNKTIPTLKTECRYLFIFTNEHVYFELRTESTHTILADHLPNVFYAGEFELERLPEQQPSIKLWNNQSGTFLPTNSGIGFNKALEIFGKDCFQPFI